VRAWHGIGVAVDRPLRRYRGAMKREELTEFLSRFAPQPSDPAHTQLAELELADDMPAAAVRALAREL
jgi:hypothetical protein